MEEKCLLACSLWFAKHDFLYKMGLHDQGWHRPQWPRPFHKNRESGNVSQISLHAIWQRHNLNWCSFFPNMVWEILQSMYCFYWLILFHLISMVEKRQAFTSQKGLVLTATFLYLYAQLEFHFIKKSILNFDKIISLNQIYFHYIELNFILTQLLLK